MKKNKLPAPRLQLRWEKVSEYDYHCHYELVIKLGEFDIRREVYDADGNELKKLPLEYAIAMKEPTTRNCSAASEPCGVKPFRYADTPYRDGAHAKWDSVQLGGLPIFVIATNGEAFKVEELEKS